MLRVTLMGHLGSDAELRHSAKDTPIASFRVAVNQVRTNAAGQREESTETFTNARPEHDGRFAVPQPLWLVALLSRLLSRRFPRQTSLFTSSLPGAVPSPSIGSEGSGRGA
jgi:hypothetical protein